MTEFPVRRNTLLLSGVLICLSGTLPLVVAVATTTLVIVTGIEGILGLGPALALIGEWQPQDFAKLAGFELILLLGFGFALFSSPNTNAVMSAIDKRFYGVGSAILGTMRLTGQMLSMGVAMVIFALHIGSARITSENYAVFLTSMKTAFVIFASLCCAGIFASLARGKVR